jgi:hypothetical protein
MAMRTYLQLHTTGAKPIIELHKVERTGSDALDIADPKTQLTIYMQREQMLELHAAIGKYLTETR